MPREESDSGLLLLPDKEVLLRIENPTANPSQWFYSNTLSPY